MLSRDIMIRRASKTFSFILKNQVRYARTKVTPEELRDLFPIQAPTEEELTEQLKAHKEKLKEEQLKNFIVSDLVPKSKPTRSRFAQKKDVLHKSKSTLPKEWQADSPDTIEKTIKENFKRDGMEYDPKFVQTIIEESKIEEGLLEQVIKDKTADKVIDDLSKQDLLEFLDWMIEDASKRVEDQHTSSVEVERESLKKIDKFKHDLTPENTQGALDAMDTLFDDVKGNGLKILPQFLERISDVRLSEIRRWIPLDYALGLYGISSQIIDLKTRDECIYYSGNLIYESTKQRMDPINEMFYMESLVSHGKQARAIELFETRKNKPDVKNQRFWLDIGVNAYLKANNNIKAEEIAQEMREKHGYVHPILITSLIYNYLQNDSDYEKACKWWLEMKNIMDEYGLVEEIEVPEVKVFDKKHKNVVYDYHNRTDPVSFTNITNITLDFFRFGKYDKGMEIIEVATKRDKNFILHVTQVFNDLDYPAREGLYHILNDDNENKYHSAIKSFIMEELDQDSGRYIKTESYIQVQLLDDLRDCLNVIATQPELIRSKKILVKSLLFSINAGNALTRYECGYLLELLFSKRSIIRFNLANRLLDEMKDSFLKHKKRPFFAAITWHEFHTLIVLFGRPNKVRLPYIYNTLDDMKALNIPVNTAIMTDVIDVHIRQRQFSKAMEYVHTHIASDNFAPTPEFFRTALRVYNKGLKHDRSLPEEEQQIDHRIASDNLRIIFKSIRSYPEVEFEEMILNEAVISFLTYNDYPAALGVLEYYGLILCKDIPRQTVLLIKLKLESSLLKMASKASPELMKSKALQEKMDLCREELGLLSMRKPTTVGDASSWREVSSILVTYMELFDFKPNPYSLAHIHTESSISDAQLLELKQKFEKELIEIQQAFELPIESLDDICR